MRLLLSSVLLLAAVTIMAQPVPAVSTGKVEHIQDFPTNLIETRNVDVWLPEGYDSSQRYAVVYMHDGQMLFDPAITWNKTAWEADETFGRLLGEGKIKDCIIVGIWNIPERRFADYFPQKVIDSIPEPTHSTILNKQINGKPGADSYLEFIVSELKPYIDRTYATLPDAENTFMIGSSMGGLISLYGLCEYPDVFGGVACLSTHSPLASYELINEHTDAEVASKFRNYLREHLPAANTKKIYFDYGDQTGDAFYAPYQAKIDSLMQQLGYDNKHWQTHFFAGESHSEISWAKRLSVPVLFLLER